MAGIDPTLQYAVIERHAQDAPKPGVELEAWSERVAPEYGIPASRVRRIIAEEAAVMLQAVNNRSQTVAQKVADVMGANLTAAFDVLREAYGATKKKILLDQHGRPKEDENGNYIWLEVPDWQSRLAAVRSTIEVFGARPPQQIEVSSHSINLNISPSDALAELARLTTDIPKLQAAYARQLGSGTGPVIEAGEDAEGADRGDGLRVLADPMHQNKRRAGQRKPVQAVSGPAVPPSGA